jgi:hypothetical protein
MDVEYDPTESAYRASFGTGRSASEAVVEAVGTVADADPRHLVPLGDAVDPDALDRLCAPDTGEGSDRAVRVTFRYHGYEVTVAGSGTVEIREPGQ